MKKQFLFVIVLLVSFSCSVKQEPIHYGEDNCVLCQMTIMDQRYGTEIVTGKGKIYKFDSVECLVEFMQENQGKGEEFRFVLFTPFDQPGNLVDAHKSHVLQSKNLPSPMGMYLTAFETEASAMNFRDQYGGKVYCWEELLENFSLLKTLER